MAQNPGRGKMAQESSGKQCLIHIPKKTGDLQKSTAYTATKIREFCRQWIDLDGNQQVIASRIASTVESWPENITNDEEFYYHKECYIRFCDKQQIARAEKRIQKSRKDAESNKVTPECHDQNSSHSLNSPEESSCRKSARLYERIETQDRPYTEQRPRSKHVLPEHCIICKKKDVYITDKVGANCDFCEKLLSKVENRYIT